MAKKGDETRARIDAIMADGEWRTPTEIGLALRICRENASSRVCAYLKKMVLCGEMEKRTVPMRMYRKVGGKR